VARAVGECEWINYYVMKRAKRILKSVATYPKKIAAFTEDNKIWLIW